MLTRLNNLRRPFANRIFNKMEKTNFKVSTQIKLLPIEEKLFEIFRTAASRSKKDPVLRVAGGWVRDKILGRESSDIDIALDNMLGAEFAAIVQEVYNEVAPADKRPKGFGVIKANPDKSKRLETATINLEDNWIDFVNLRKEEYNTDSRIPEMQFGTPLEDAERRDLTINALFYNLNENKVEDFTEKGIKDLENGIIRTPLEPVKTFLDDPLRILRVFRFAARYNFEIIPEVLEAVLNSEVVHQFTTKISRERVGKEIEPTLEHENGIMCLNLLYNSKLLPVIFDTSPKSVDKLSNSDIEALFVNNSKIWGQIKSLTEEINTAHPSFLDTCSSADPEERAKTTRAVLLLSSSLWGFHLKKHNKKMTLTEFFVKESLKLKNKTNEEVKTVQAGAQKLLTFVEKGASNFEAYLSEDEHISDLGMWIRETGLLYPLAFILACSVSKTLPSALCSQLALLPAFIASRGLSGFHEEKPLLNGNDLKKAFKLEGKQIKETSDGLLRWQARNRGAQKEAALEHLQKQFKAS